MNERVGEVEEVATEGVEVLGDPPLDDGRDGGHAKADSGHPVGPARHQASDGSDARGSDDGIAPCSQTTSATITPIESRGGNGPDGKLVQVPAAVGGGEQQHKKYGDHGQWQQRPGQPADQWDGDRGRGQPVEQERGGQE
jgi:hypothetical protein